MDTTRTDDTGWSFARADARSTVDADYLQERFEEDERRAVRFEASRELSALSA